MGRHREGKKEGEMLRRGSVMACHKWFWVAPGTVPDLALPVMQAHWLGIPTWVRNSSKRIIRHVSHGRIIRHC